MEVYSTTKRRRRTALPSERPQPMLPSRPVVYNQLDRRQRSSGRAVSDNDGASNYVLENASNGTTVGITGLASDPDGTDVVTYSLDNNAGGRLYNRSEHGCSNCQRSDRSGSGGFYNITIRATSTDTSLRLKRLRSTLATKMNSTSARCR